MGHSLWLGIYVDGLNNPCGPGAENVGPIIINTGGPPLPQKIGQKMAEWDGISSNLPEELINPLVCDDRERAGVVEDMVVFVLLPKPEVGVAQPVVEELVEVGQCQDHEQRAHVVGEGVVTPAAEGLEKSVGLIYSKTL